MIVIAITLFLAGNKPQRPVELVLTALLAIAMGIQAATARHLAVKDITTVVVTSLITGLAADSRIGGGVGQPWVRRVAALALICAGATGGALAISLHLGAGRRTVRHHRAGGHAGRAPRRARAPAIACRR